MSKNKYFKKIALVCIALLTIIITWGGLVSAPALSQLVESRLSALEVDTNRIESRLNQIESRLNQLRTESPKAPFPPSPSNLGRRRQLSREEMFDRLATLVIELREQIRELEARVSKLESRGTPRSK